MKPYYEDDHVTLFHGDCLELADLWTGADVLVTAAPGGPSGDAGPDPDWPLPLLIAAWLRGAAAPSARLADSDDAEGIVFVLDGPNTLTARAPGGHRPEDAAIFAA